ncbi:class I SAM-dependent methyltransferase [candidate division WWE3 bacterium]|nr:class I SAM-dependent methyltransferase [candidate division WWE3 bacterium]
MPLNSKIEDPSNHDWKHNDLADRFNTHKAMDEIHPDAAVNIYVGWPVFFEQIKYQMEFLGRDKLNILDFGCGTGEFCKNLHMKGHKVVGMDKSDSMLEIAKGNSPHDISYCLKELVDSDGECSIFYNQMDVITAMHSFEWNKNIDDIVKDLDKFLVPKGIMLFAVFPKGHVIESLKIKDLFEDFDSEENPTEGFCNFDGVKIPVYIKDPTYFDDIFKKMNYEKVLEFYPQLPKTFLEKYEWHAAMYPEMVILAYRKTV